MDLKTQRVVQLQAACMTYAWGKIGEESLVALLRKEQPEFTLDKEMTYAELWMGSHIKHPSKLLNLPNDGVIGENILLDHWIKRDPVATLGKNVFETFGASLPYLFKVLSINKALSIQAHPAKAHAEKLHLKHPDIYADPNHKPEMAIALTKFEALCGFRPVSEILNYFHEVHELLEVVGQEAVDELINAEMATEKSCRSDAVKKALKRCMGCLMNCHPDVVKDQLRKFVERLNDCHMKREDTTPYLGRLFLRLHGQFPGDVGCFCIYFLNYINMEPSESIFLGPNIPHAYLSGDIIECMACSDNVVRAGLTPKYKDVETLIEMLAYTPQTVEQTKFKPVAIDRCTSEYNPPVKDFSVKKINIKAGDLTNYTFQSLNGPSIILTISGRAQLRHASSTFNIHKGAVFFVCSGEEIRLDNIDPKEELLLFQAYCDLSE